MTARLPAGGPLLTIAVARRPRPARRPARPVLLGFLVVALVAAPCATPRTEPREALGGTWTAVDVAGLVPDPLNAPRIQFTDGGRIQGVTGCNDFSGDALIDGERIAIGALENTDVGCPAEVRAIETAFVGALRAAQTITGGSATGRLVLSGPGGDIVFVQPGP